MTDSILSWNVGLDWRLDPKQRWMSPFYPTLRELRKKQQALGRNILQNNLQDTDLEVVASTILEHNPTAFFLHEVAKPEQVRELIEELQGAYVGDIGQLCNSRYSAYFVREGTPYAPKKFYVYHQNNSLLYNTIFSGVKPKGFLGLHLQGEEGGMGILSGKATAGPFVAAWGGRYRELEQVAMHADNIFENKPVIILGDMNMLEPESLSPLQRNNPLMQAAFRNDERAQTMLTNKGFTDLDATQRRPTDIGLKFRLDRAWERGDLQLHQQFVSTNRLDYALTKGIHATFDVLPVEGIAELGFDHYPVSVSYQALP